MSTSSNQPPKKQFVPLPNQVPESRGTRTSYSETVESLIHQNEDLMARLSITIRKNAELENRLQLLQQNSQVYESKVSALHDELSIEREKGRYGGGRYREIEQANLRMQREIEEFQVRFAQLSDHLSQAEKQRRQLSSRLRLLERFRLRIRQLVGPRFKRQKAEIKKLENYLVEYQTQIVAQNRQIQTIEEKTARDQATLVEQYELQLEAIEKQMTQIEKDLEFHRARSLRVDELTEATVELENRAIFADRRRIEVEQQLLTETERLSAEVSNSRSLISNLEKELLCAQEEVRYSTETTKQAQREAQLYREKFEGLQLLWSKNHDRVLTLETQNSSLNKLNQELSVQLVQYRAEVERLQERFNAYHTEAENRLYSIQDTMFENQRKTVSREQKNQAVLDNTEKAIGKMENLLVEIQSGFSKTKNIIDSKLEGLSFVESQRPEETSHIKSETDTSTSIDKT